MATSLCIESSAAGCPSVLSIIHLLLRAPTLYLVQALCHSVALPPHYPWRVNSCYSTPWIQVGPVTPWADKVWQKWQCASSGHSSYLAWQLPVLQYKKFNTLYPRTPCAENSSKPFWEGLVEETPGGERKAKEHQVTRFEIKKLKKLTPTNTILSQEEPSS